MYKFGPTFESFDLQIKAVSGQNKKIVFSLCFPLLETKRSRAVPVRVLKILDNYVLWLTCTSSTSTRTFVLDSKLSGVPLSRATRTMS